MLQLCTTVCLHVLSACPLHQSLAFVTGQVACDIVFDFYIYFCPLNSTYSTYSVCCPFAEVEMVCYLEKCTLY